jgi:Fe-S cluster assembly protein SufB
MLKVGRLADYGVLILHHLGRVRPARLSMETLSELTHVPLPTVRKVMRFLIEAGLVLSKRGPLGGYQLARAPEAISLADAITALEGRPALTACSSDHGLCEIADQCELADRWPGVNAIVLQVLERTTLADLGRFGRHDPHIPPPLRELLAPHPPA